MTHSSPQTGSSFFREEGRREREGGRAKAREGAGRASADSTINNGAAEPADGGAHAGHRAGRGAGASRGTDAPRTSGQPGCCAHDPAPPAPPGPAAPPPPPGDRAGAAVIGSAPPPPRSRPPIGKPDKCRVPWHNSRIQTYYLANGLPSCGSATPCRPLPHCERPAPSEPVLEGLGEGSG